MCSLCSLMVLFSNGFKELLFGVLELFSRVIIID